MTLRTSPAEIVRKAEGSGHPNLLGTAPSWIRVRLGSIASITNGAPFKSEHFNVEGRGMPLIRIRDVGGSAIQTWYDGPWDAQHLVRAGDLLVGMDGDFRAARWEGPDGLLNQRVCKISTTVPDYDQRFLALVIQGYLDAIWSATSSVTVKHLSSRSIADIPLPKPPIEEQRRIVDIVEDHLSRLGTADASVSTALRRVAQLKTSLLQVGLRGELVGDDLSKGTAHDLVGKAAGAFRPNTDDRLWSLPPTWAWVRLGDVFEVNVGSTPSRDNTALWSGDLPWVSSGEVAFGRIRSTRERIARTAAGNPDKRIHPPGTVMLAMIGEGRTRGQAAILDIEAAHNQNCASIRVSETEVLPEYLYGYLEERYLETRRRGSGGQQPALNKAAIQKFAVPIAPLATQRALVDAWDRMAEQAEPLANALRSAGKRNASLRRALLSAAFSGTLTGATSDSDRIEERASTP